MTLVKNVTFPQYRRCLGLRSGSRAVGYRESARRDGSHVSQWPPHCAGLVLQVDTAGHIRSDAIIAAWL
jgi:hypothetical protein